MILQYNKASKQHFINIPKEIVDAYNLKKGDVLLPQVNSQGNIEFIRLKSQGK